MGPRRRAGGRRGGRRTSGGDVGPVRAAPAGEAVLPARGARPVQDRTAPRAPRRGPAPRAGAPGSPPPGGARGRHGTLRPLADRRRHDELVANAAFAEARPVAFFKLVAI